MSQSDLGARLRAFGADQLTGFGGLERRCADQLEQFGQAQRLTKREQLEQSMLGRRNARHPRGDELHQ